MTEAIRARIDGHDVVAVVPTLNEDLPALIREGIARRRLMAAGHPCPCGAAAIQLNRALRREMAARQRRGHAEPIRVAIEHERDCPASDEAIDALAARYGLGVHRWWSP